MEKKMQKLFGGDLKPDFPASLRGFSSSPCSPDSCLGRGNAKRPLEARGVSESPREAAGQISQSLLEPTPPEGSRQRPQAVKGEGHAWHGAAQGTALDTGGLDKKLADAVPAPPAPAAGPTHTSEQEERGFLKRGAGQLSVGHGTDAGTSERRAPHARGQVCAEQTPSLASTGVSSPASLGEPGGTHGLKGTM